MFNLIRRDLILQRKMVWVFIPFVAVFIVTNKDPLLIFLIASVFIPFNALSYEEKAETNILLNSLPYTRKQIIAARYLGSIVYMMLSIGVTAIVLFVLDIPFSLWHIAMASGLFLLFAAFTFPLFTILKPGYITLGVIMGFLVAVSIGQFAPLFVEKHATGIMSHINDTSTLVLYIESALAVLAVYGTSWLVTTVIYQRKAF